MSYILTYDEKSTGFYSSIASSYSDAPYSLSTIYTLAEGVYKAAHGLLYLNGTIGDADTYSMGVLSAGTYTVTGTSAFWFYGIGFASYITPSVQIYDSQGNNINAAGSFSSKYFTVTTPGTYYTTVFGTTYAASQYELYYSYASVNKAPVLAVPLLNRNWTEGTSLYFTVPSGTFTDPENNPLTYSATLNTGAALPTWLSFKNSTQNFSGTAPVGSPDFTVRITAIDTGGLSTFDDVVFFTPTAVTLATYVPYTPESIIGKALFNFDAVGVADYKIEGTVVVSVSDAFTYYQYITNKSLISSDIYTALSSGNGNWTASQLSNVNLILGGYSSLVNLSFSPVINLSGNNPLSVGSLSNINISLIYRTDLNYSGLSAMGTDTSFLYLGSNGDIVLNVNGFGSAGLGNDETLNFNSYGFHTLMHEIGHSLGLSHPHSAMVNGVAILTTDYSATINVGFTKLGFQIKNSSDMNKEYFSIMSYDDDKPPGAPDTFAQTPMILDVIALQGAYGEGAGSSGIGNDTITPGAAGVVNSFRTYFDKGGVDTIDLTNYMSGALLNMGTTILGATHLVGVSMSTDDAVTMIGGGDPASLRWFYGEFENASGSKSADVIVGNTLNNIITGGGGNDGINGGSGIDTAMYIGRLANYLVTKSTGSYNATDKTGADGVDTLTNIERLQFTDKTINLTVQAKAAAAPQADVARLSELYVAFFNRIPDADGMSYWIDQKSAGQSITSIAESFYAAGVQYSSLTGFSAGMTNADFVKVVYKNVLSRTGSTAPPDADVNYWANNINTGVETRGSLINTILSVAHDFKGDATWGWVPNLLDNKIAVAKTFALDWGLNYNTSSDSITQGMAIAAAITPASTAAAISLIGVDPTALHLG